MEIKSGPEPHFTNLQQFSREIPNLSNDDLITKWCSLLYIMNSVPKCGARPYVLQTFDLYIKIRFWTIRLATIIPYLPRSQSAEVFQTKITELLSKFSSNERLDTNIINDTLSIITELLILIEEIDLGPNHTRAFIKFENFTQFLDQLTTNIKKIQEIIVFAESINSISACFNRYTIQKLDSIQLNIKLNIESTTSDNASVFTGKMHITNEEKFLLLNVIDALTKQDIKVTSDAGIDINSSHLYPPNLEKVFLSLKSFSNLDTNTFSHDFITGISKLITRPSNFSDVISLLSESVMNQAYSEFNGSSSEKIIGLTDQLTQIYLVHMFFMTLDYLSICSYDNSVSLTYVRTLASIAMKKDVFIPVLTEILSNEKIIFLKNQIESKLISIYDDNYNSIMKYIRKNFVYLFIEYLKISNTSFTPLLQFLFDVDANKVNYSEIPDFGSIFRQIKQDLAPKLFYTVSLLIPCQHNAAIHGNNDVCYDYLFEFFKNHGIDFNNQPKSVLNHSELIDEFGNSLLYLMERSVLPGLNENDLDFLKNQDDPKFIGQFVQFIKSLSIDHRVLTKLVVKSCQNLQKNYSKENSDLILQLDMISRGSLDVSAFLLIISSNSLSNNQDILNCLLIFIYLFRFFNLRDEIINEMVEIEPSIKNESVLMNSLKHFNKKRFIDGFSNIIMFVYTLADTDSASNKDFLHNIMNLLRLNNTVPDFFSPTQTQAYEIDTAFWKITSHLNKIKIEKLVGRIQNLLKSIDNQPLGVNNCTEFVAAVDQFTKSQKIDYQPIQKIGSFVAKLIQYDTKNSFKTSDYIIAFFNTISVYKNLIPSIYSYFCFLLSNRSSVKMKIPLLLSIKTPAPEELNLMPLQFFTGICFPEFQIFICRNQITQIKKLIEDKNISNDISNLSFNDDCLLPVESQNIILNSIQSHGQSNKEKEYKNHLVGQLIEIRKKTMEEKKNSEQLKKTRKVSYTKNQNELMRLKKELFGSFDVYKNENTQLDMQIEHYKMQIEAYKKSIENKKSLIENLKQQICAIKGVKELKTPVLPERKPFNQKFTAKISEFRFFDENSTEIPESSDIPTSPELVDEVIVEIPHAQQQIPEIKQEIEEMVETPASLRNLIGDKWPLSLQNSISNSLKQITSSDSVKAMRVLKDASPDSLSRIKNLLSGGKVDSGEALIQNDVMRRITVIKEMFDE
ncbi:hypothetical protein TVAG_388010 [Trichomonas vaginalis G3]|uniref:Uncharacterized protein n=2 Tax=Trichomonas vaginalis (strain ATCC PRA-98 / G3) TaxID=412133 RepID=A2E128_TRIV3|nr:hypothetical protein TVAGG3_0330900 [Trichomonas vaginalis G3]EAY13660.1 hypothetical protein TVAG_388010 [Trichomonas vaginalis G3]KAI5529954.1 hypothetical protein TVAGG3_0330900 [Trichomonas vaginalis G3]|eukprot:XP_001325883.1 hypothetical protein [Trichomonas vaginalis G3]